MADDVKAGYRLEVEGTQEFVEDTENASTAIDGFTEAAGKASGAVSSLDEAMDGMASGSAESSRAFEDNMTAAADEAAAACMNAIAFIGEVNAAIIAGVNGVAEKGDAVAKGAQQIGFSTEAYQEWAFILERSNSSVGKAKNAMEALTKASRNASDKQAAAFEQLGLSLESVEQMNPEHVFAAVIEGLQAIEDQGERSAIADTLLGSGYKNLGTLLSSSAEETEAMRRQAHDLRQVMDEDAVAAAVTYQDSIENFNAAIDGVKTNLLEGLMPALSTAREGITNFIANDVDWDAVDEKIGTLTEKLTADAQWLVEHGSEVAAVVETVGGAWVAWKGTEVVMETLDGVKKIYSWLDLVGQALGVTGGAVAGGIGLTALGVATVVDHANDLKTVGYLGNGHELQEYVDNIAYYEEKLAEAQAFYDETALWSPEGLIMAQDQLDMAKISLQNAREEYEAMQAAREAAESTGEDPTETLAKSTEVLSAAVETVEEVGTAAVGANTQVQTAAGEMLETIAESAGELRDDWASGVEGMAETAANEVIAANDAMAQNMEILASNAEVWGEDMMISMANGIINGANAWVLPRIDEVAAAIEARIGFSEPEIGPLSKFHTFAPDMMELFAKGVTDYAPLVHDAITDAFDLGAYIQAPTAALGTSLHYGGVNVTFNVQEGQNGRELFEEFSYWLQNEISQEGAVFAQ